MPLIHMVLADKDAEYVHRLAQWFRENRTRQFRISAFTSQDSFSKYLQSGDITADVILLNESFLTPQLMEKGNIIVLGSCSTELPSVEKYQTASSLCSAILSHLSGWEPVKPEFGYSGKSNIIVCFSPELRLKSTLALWLAAMSRDHLHISLEAFPYYSLNREADKTLSDIIYHIKASKSNLSIVLESSVAIYGGITYIPPMDNPLDLWELTDKETCILTEAILSWGRFSNIIVDTEFNTSPRTLQWLEAASRVIVPFTATYPQPILKMKSVLSTLPGAGTGKYRWVLASQNSSESLQQYFDAFHSLPWLEELNYRGSLSLETHMLEQLKALIAG